MMLQRKQFLQFTKLRSHLSLTVYFEQLLHNTNLKENLMLMALIKVRLMQ